MRVLILAIAGIVVSVGRGLLVVFAVAVAAACSIVAGEIDSADVVAVGAVAPDIVVGVVAVGGVVVVGTVVVVVALVVGVVSVSSVGALCVAESVEAGDLPLALPSTHYPPVPV